MADIEKVIDAYVNIDTIPGEAMSKGFEKQIQIYDFSHGIRQEPSSTRSSAGAQATGRVDTGRITFSKNVDAATPQLMLACAEGRHINKIRFSFTRAGTVQNIYYTVTLEDSLITNVGQHAGDRDVVHEEVELYFRKIEWEYFQTDQKGGGVSGSQVTGWDSGKNASV